MSAIALKEDQKTLPGIPEPKLDIVEIMQRAIFDPDVDADKVERVMRMAREFKQDEARAAYARALIAMKPKLPVIDRRGRIVITDKNNREIILQSTPYALYDDIDAAITPILAQFGFVLTHRTGSMPDGKVTVTGVLTHELGHAEESMIALPLDTSGSKNNVQAAGSSISYGQRYTAKTLLNLRFKGEDDDGEGNGGYHSAPAKQPNPIAEAMDQEVEDGIKNWVDQQKTFLTNCDTIAEIQEWEELRKDPLDRLRRKALPAWNDLRKFKETKIGNINLKGVK